MRPYPDEILRSMRYSLDAFVIPNVADSWGSYAAKVMKRMLVHLERRWELEGVLLVEDTTDLRAVLDDTARRLAALPIASATEMAAATTEALRATDAPPSGYVSIRDLTARNDTLREALVGIIEGLDTLAGGEHDEVVDALRSDICQYLRRQVDRDNQLAEPAFMSFAPPAPAGSASRDDAA